jgi:hypothetical protein
MTLTARRQCFLGFMTAIAISAFSASPSYAQLNVFQTYTGSYGVSTDGASDPALRTDQSGNGIIRAGAPSGSTVVAAYLYTTTYTFGSPPDFSGVTLNGTTVNYTATFPNATACCSLSSSRADVTSIVAPVINGGSGGIYNFTYAEGRGSGNIDGSALVVVYSNPAIPTTTIGILNGAASVTGDTAHINFSTPLNPGDPGFVANMIIGDGFSCCGQMSNISVNGNLMTSVAGNHDDSAQEANGNLITVGSFFGSGDPNNDPFTVASVGSPANNYNTDHELYDLRPFLNNGDTSITIDTFNASQDDNIFLAVFDVTGEASIVNGQTPLPASMWLLGSALGGLGLLRRRQKRKALVTA